MRSQAVPPRRTAYRNVFNFPLGSGNATGRQKAHYLAILLDHQGNLVARSFWREQFCVLLLTPARRRGRVAGYFHQPGQVGWLRWPHAHVAHAKFVLVRLACTAFTPMVNRLMSAPKILSRPMLR